MTLPDVHINPEEIQYDGLVQTISHALEAAQDTVKSLVHPNKFFNQAYVDTIAYQAKRLSILADMLEKLTTNHHKKLKEPKEAKINEASFFKP